MTSEKQVLKKVNGVYKKVWKKTRERNEPFDLFNYNYATVELIRPEWDKLEEKIKHGVNYMRKRPPKRTVRRSINGIEG